MKLRHALTEHMGAQQFNSDGSAFLLRNVVHGEELLLVIICYMDDLIFSSYSKHVLDSTVNKFLTTEPAFTTNRSIRCVSHALDECLRLQLINW